MNQFCAIMLISAVIGKIEASPFEPVLISDFHLNAVCHELCFDETVKCIMSCDPTDSECYYTCARAEAVCIESKYSKLICSSFCYKIHTLILLEHSKYFQAAHVILTVQMVVMAVKTQSASAR